jgi:hypothetical protein
VDGAFTMPDHPPILPLGNSIPVWLDYSFFGDHQMVIIDQLIVI